MNYGNNKNLRVVITFTDQPDSDPEILEKIRVRVSQMLGQPVRSPRKKLSIEDSLTRKSGISKDLTNELL